MNINSVASSRPLTQQASPSVRPGQTALARQFAGVSNGAANSTSSRPGSMLSAIPFRPVSTPPTGNPVIAPQQSDRQRKEFKAFSTLYSTNAGAKEINQVMRGKPWDLSITKVMAEIGKRNGEQDISSYKKGGIDIKGEMKSLAAKAEILRVADDIYARTKLLKLSPEHVHRGQGMTSAGVDQLITLWKAGIPVKATHFLSCDKDIKVAQSFAKNCSEGKEEPVLFQIRGFSNVRLRSHLEVSGESESLFTPHATFKIDQIATGKNTGQLIVRLTEIPQAANTVLLPY
jgi:hypothetical protein